MFKLPLDFYNIVRKKFCVEKLSHILFVYQLNMKTSGFLIVSGEIN